MGDILYLNVFTVFVCLLINTKHAHCITLKLQNYNPVEGRQFELDCNTVSTIVGNVVILFPDGTTAGSCTPAISPFPSSCSNAAGYTASISESTFNVTLTTNSLPSDVNGTWTCTHSGDSETYNLNNILQINNEAFDIQPGSFSNNITSSSDVSLSATYGCINEAVSFKWTLVSDLSSTELTRRPSTVKLNTSICTTDPGLDGYSETIASNELFTMYPNLDGDYRLGVEVHYEGEVVAIQSIQYFDTYFIFRPYTSTESTTEISTNLQTTTLEITSSTTYDLVTDDIITTKRIAESTTGQTMVTNTVTKSMSHGFNVDWLMIYYWCSVLVILFLELGFFIIVHVKHRPPSNHSSSGLTRTTHTATENQSKPIESHYQTKQSEFIQHKESFENSTYDLGRKSNRKNYLSRSQVQYDSSRIRTNPDRSMMNYRPKMSMEYDNKVYISESSEPRAPHFDNCFKLYRGGKSSPAYAVNMNKDFGNSNLYMYKSRRLELNRNSQPEFYYQN